MNSDGDERAFLVRREQQERRKAAESLDQPSALAHAQLADLYAARLRALGGGRA